MNTSTRQQAAGCSQRVQRILLLGSTGSIGVQTLDIVRRNPDRFQVVGLTANRNAVGLADQVREFRPRFALLAEENGHRLEQQLGSDRPGETEIVHGHEQILELVTLPEVDVVVNALVGFAGFHPTIKALEAGKRVALANKESLVIGGELIAGMLGTTGGTAVGITGAEAGAGAGTGSASEDAPGRETASGVCADAGRRLIPIDSEHSAILQCLLGEPEKSVEQLIITASGGPFRDWPLPDLQHVTVNDALNHPNWDMGAKITVDSATMMNKGLEIIEAHWLFDIPLSQLQAVIHPQSIVHSMVTFTDGTTKAELGLPDMKVPIQYALTYPSRWPLDTPRIDWSRQQQLTFAPVEPDRFPCYPMALEAIRQGGHAPAILNAANEIAVGRFLNQEISYQAIPRIVESCLEHIDCNSKLSVSSLYGIDDETRAYARNLQRE